MRLDDEPGQARGARAGEDGRGARPPRGAPPPKPAPAPANNAFADALLRARQGKR
jgi:uncharacterized protein